MTRVKGEFARPGGLGPWPAPGGGAIITI